MKVIKRIGVVSLAKLMAVSMAGVAVIIGIVYGIVIAIMAVIGGLGLMSTGEAESVLTGGASLGLGLLLALGAVVGLPLFYGVFGFVFGLLYGWIVNLALRLSGGLEVDIREVG